MTPEWLDAWTPAEGADRDATLFRARFDSEPDGTWSAPGRVNLNGEHTDDNGGLCLPIALPHRTYVALRRRDDDTVRLVSAQEPAGLRTIELADVAPGTVEGWAGYVAGVAGARRQAGLPVPGGPSRGGRRGRTRPGAPRTSR